VSAAVESATHVNEVVSPTASSDPVAVRLETVQICPAPV
jgi:hypothetical protein